MRTYRMEAGSNTSHYAVNLEITFEQNAVIKECTGHAQTTPQWQCKCSAICGSLFV